MSMSKPSSDLTLEDFQEHPIWEWALDEETDPGKDETWVKPLVGRRLIRRADIKVLALAEATLADGTQMPVTASVSTWPEIKISSLCFWTGEDGIDMLFPPAIYREYWPERFPERIGKPTEDVFPLQVRLLVPLEDWTGDVTASVDERGITLLVSGPLDSKQPQRDNGDADVRRCR